MNNNEQTDTVRVITRELYDRNKETTLRWVMKQVLADETICNEVILELIDTWKKTSLFNKLDKIYNGIKNAHSLRKTMNDLLDVKEASNDDILECIDYWKRYGPHD